jgi:hypothetical protein
LRRNRQVNNETYSHHHNLTAPLFALTGAKTTNFQIGDRKEDMFWRVHLWVPKMPSESLRPEFHQTDEFNFDSAFVNSDNSASHSLGQTNLRKIRPSFRDGPFGLFRRINLIAPIRFLRLDLPSISIREHINRAGSAPTELSSTQ